MFVEPLKMGVIGVGGRGRSQVKQLVDSQDVKVVAVADVRKETVDSVAAEFGVKGYTSHQALLDDAGVEAIFIAAPHPFHAPIACDAAERRVHVLTEKPIAVTVSEADRMIEACRKNNVLLGVMFQQRLLAQHRKAKEIIDSGQLGEIFEFEMISNGWFRLQSYYDQGGWRGTWKGEGGGIVANQAPHNLDILAWLMGMPRSISAALRTRVHRIEVENTVQAIFEYDGLKTGYFRATTADPLGKNRLEIIGDKGRLVLEGGKLRLCRYARSVTDHIFNAESNRSEFGIEWEEVALESAPAGHAEVVTRFVRAIRYGEPLVATGEDGRNALELANAMHLSGFLKSSVSLPLDRAAVDNLFQELREGKRKVS